MKKHRTSLWVVAVVTAAFAIETALFLQWIPDDAFISFRYARNLADGLGPVFNAGERVEGASNPLWTVLLALLTAAGLDTVKSAVTLSLGCSLLSVVCLFWLFDVAMSGGRRQEARDRWLAHKLVLAAGFIASLPMIFYATSGLETHAELLCLTVGAILHLEARSQRDGRRYLASQCAFLVVALLRPEGVLFLIAGAGFILVGRSNPAGWGKRAAVALPVAAYVAFFVAKATYYGELVPNTYLAKPGAGIGYLKPLLRGMKYTVRFFAVSGLIALVPLCVAAFADARRRYACVFLACIAVVQLLFIVFVGGDVLRFDRFTLPFTPPLLTLALVGVSQIGNKEAGRVRRLPLATVALCVILMIALNGGRIHRVLKKTCYHDWMHSLVHRQVGAYLRDALPPNASVVVNEVGAIGYETMMVTHDMIGLTDATVARILYESYHRFGVSGSDWSVPRIADYLMSKKPTCIIIPAYSRLSPDVNGTAGRKMHPIWEGVFMHPDLNRYYSLGLSLRIHDRKFWYVYFRGKSGDDLPPPTELTETSCLELLYYRESP